MNGNKMDFDDLNIDEIINANMTITDHKLRDAIHAVCVDVIYAVAAAEREALLSAVEEIERENRHFPISCDVFRNAIRARGEQK